MSSLPLPSRFPRTDERWRRPNSEESCAPHRPWRYILSIGRLRGALPRLARVVPATAWARGHTAHARTNTPAHGGQLHFPRLTPIALQSLLYRDDDYTMLLHVVWRYLLLSFGIRSYATAPISRSTPRCRLPITESL